MFRSILNILWVVLGGLPMALGWWLAGLVSAISIVGLPWSRSCFVIGRFALWPFGFEAINRLDLSGRVDLGTGPMGLFGNVIWFLVAGWWLVAGDWPPHLGTRLLRLHHWNPLRNSTHQTGSHCHSSDWNDDRSSPSH